MHYTYESFLKELGVRLKQMRKDRGWTLRTMVVDHQFHVTHWQGFENGKAISVPSLLRVCEVFDVSLEDLVRGLGRSTALKVSPEQGSVLVPAPAEKKPPRAKRSTTAKARS